MLADDLDTRLRALLQSDPAPRATDSARSTVLGERAARQPRPRHGWRLTLAIGVPAIAAIFGALLVFRSSSADAPRPSATPGWETMTPGERVATNLGWGLSSGVTHIRFSAGGSTAQRGEIWSLNAPAAELSAAFRVQTGSDLNAQDPVRTLTAVTRSDGTRSGQMATADVNGTVRIRSGVPTALVDMIEPQSRQPHNSLWIPDKLGMLARAMASGALQSVPGPTGSETMRFTGDVRLLRAIMGDPQMTVTGDGPAIAVDVDTTRWVPTRVTTHPSGTTPAVEIWDVVEQLPSDPGTLDHVFDLRRAYPDAQEDDEPPNSSSDSSSDRGSTNPTEVVHMFVDAVDSGDPARAKRLCTPEFARRADATTDSWFHQSVRLKLTKVGTIRTLRAAQVGLPDRTEVVHIPVELDVMQEHPQSISNGPLTWGYTLARQSDGSWLIADNGVG